MLSLSVIIPKFIIETLLSAQLKIKFQPLRNTIHYLSRHTAADVVIVLKKKLRSYYINILYPELYFLVLAQPVYKMRIIQEPNTIEL